MTFSHFSFLQDSVSLRPSIRFQGSQGVSLLCLSQMWNCDRDALLPLLACWAQKQAGGSILAPSVSVSGQGLCLCQAEVCQVGPTARAPPRGCPGRIWLFCPAVPQSLPFLLVISAQLTPGPPGPCTELISVLIQNQGAPEAKWAWSCSLPGSWCLLSDLGPWVSDFGTELLAQGVGIETQHSSFCEVYLCHSKWPSYRKIGE